MGLRVNKGFIEYRQQINGRSIFRHFGKESDEAWRKARLFANEQERNVLLNKQQAPDEEKEILTRDAIEIFFELHSPNLTDEYARRVCRNTLNQISTALGAVQFHELSSKHCIDYWNDLLKRGCAVSTARKHFMWLMNMHRRFEAWNTTVPSELRCQVKLQKYNPAEMAKRALGKKRISTVHLKRRRVASWEEIIEVKRWCGANDPELLRAIEQAFTSFLRKKDLLEAQGKAAIGIQGKTRKEFVLPLTFDIPVNFVNWRKRWDALREHMGWLPAAKGQPKNPKRFVWHDWRHTGATKADELGHSRNLIQEALGHSSPQQTDDYLNVDGRVLRPMLNDLGRAFRKVGGEVGGKASIFGDSKDAKSVDTETQ